MHAAGDRRHHVRDHALEPRLRDRLPRPARSSGTTRSRCPRTWRCAATPSTAASPPGATGSTWPRSTPTSSASTAIPARRSGTPRSPSPATTARRSAISTRWPTARPSRPLVIKGKVIIGISGAEYGIRGFIDAYDAQDRQAALAVLHRPLRRRQVGPRPQGPGHLGGQLLADRRRLGLGHRHLRPRAQHAVLGHRQPLARLQRRGPQGRQPLHLLDPGPQPGRRLVQVALPEQPPRRLGL